MASDWYRFKINIRNCLGTGAISSNCAESWVRLLLFYNYFTAAWNTCSRAHNWRNVFFCCADSSENGCIFLLEMLRHAYGVSWHNLHGMRWLVNFWNAVFFQKFLPSSFLFPNSLFRGFLSIISGGITHFSFTPAPIYFGANYIKIGTWWYLGAAIGILNLLVWSIFGSIWWKVIGLW